jgi:hypothetical protein
MKVYASALGEVSWREESDSESHWACLSRSEWQTVCLCRLGLAWYSAWDWCPVALDAEPGLDAALGLDWVWASPLQSRSLLQSPSPLR